MSSPFRFEQTLADLKSSTLALTYGRIETPGRRPGTWGAPPSTPSSTPFGDRPHLVPRSAWLQRSAEPTVWGRAPQTPSMPKRVWVGVGTPGEDAVS